MIEKVSYNIYNKLIANGQFNKKNLRSLSGDEIIFEIDDKVKLN